jgi:hypothetical protein
MKPNDPADYVTIPRLVEYYRGGRVVGWGENVPPEFTVERKRPAPPAFPAPKP